MDSVCESCKKRNYKNAFAGTCLANAVVTDGRGGIGDAMPESTRHPARFRARDARKHEHFPLLMPESTTLETRANLVARLTIMLFGQDRFGAPQYREPDRAAGPATEGGQRDNNIRRRRADKQTRFRRRAIREELGSK